MLRRISYGFTLIELLCSIAIITVLMSTLLPALASARRQAQTVRCAANLRQVGNIFQLYAADWDNIIIPIGHWEVIAATPFAPEQYAGYWYDRCKDYFKYVDTAGRANADVLRCGAAQEQIWPRWTANGRFSSNFSFSGRVCGERGLASNEHKFHNLRGVFVLAGDGTIWSNSSGWYFSPNMDEDRTAWMHDIATPFRGHNNARIANYLFSDFHVEGRNKHPARAEWRDPEWVIH